MFIDSTCLMCKLCSRQLAFSDNSVLNPQGWIPLGRSISCKYRNQMDDVARYAFREKIQLLNLPPGLFSENNNFAM